TRTFGNVVGEKLQTVDLERVLKVLTESVLTQIRRDGISARFSHARRRQPSPTADLSDAVAQIYDGEPPPPQYVRDHKPAGRKKLSGNSSRCCIQMLSVNAAYTLCSRMTDPDPSGELLFRSVEILWNLMQHGDSEQVAKQLACQECVAQLREAFVYLLPRTFSVFPLRERRSLVLVQLLAATDCRAPFIEVGFLKQLTLFATFEEVKSHSPLVRNLKLSKNHEDFELKKLLISTLVSLSSDPCALPVLSEGHFMLALLSYVKPNEPKSKPRELPPPAYVEELQLLALSALATVGPKMQADFVSCNGCNRLLELLFWCTEASDDYLGYGNAFHGAGGRGSKRAQMRRTLRAISAMVTTNNPDILADFVDQDAIGALSEILASSVSAGNRTGQAATAAVNDDDTIDLEMKREMLGILSGLCENSLHNKDLFGPSGVATLVQFLRTDPGLLSSGLGHYQLVIGAIDAVWWCCVVGSYTTEDCFLEREGVYLLLDLLERCPSDLHSLILGVLLDLSSENEKTLPHLKTWKGGASIGCPRRPDGSIGDLLSPLMGDAQRKQAVTPQPANWPSRSIVEVAENVRAKIYALFYRIGFVDLPGINAEDHVTLTLIERYLDYKLGEVWDEVQRELELEA
uniref:Protein kinase domain-containing protein n=1 Tax=Macrostomum lignano TaxID=282301 RepID=A0A1I8FUL0_9PLAT